MMIAVLSAGACSSRSSSVDGVEVGLMIEVTQWFGQTVPVAQPFRAACARPRPGLPPSRLWRSASLAEARWQSVRAEAGRPALHAVAVRVANHLSYLAMTR